jgi:ABC-type glutathione transport system ATPase component
MRPRILIADEPTTALDARQSEAILELLVSLHRQGSTVIVITHDLDAVGALGHRVIVMAHGKVVADDQARRILLRSELLCKAGLRQPGLSTVASRVAETLGLELTAVETTIRSWAAQSDVGGAC